MNPGEVTTSSGSTGRSALPDRAVLPPVRPLAVMMASVRRDWGAARSYKLPFVMTGINLTTSVASYFFLGRLVGHGVTSEAKGQLAEGYFSFVVIGTAMLAIVSTTMTTFGRRLRTDQTTGTLEILLVSPSPAWLVIPASASYELVFSAITSISTVGFAAAVFGLKLDTSLAGGFVALFAFLGSLVLFCSFGIAFSGYILVFKRGDAGIAIVTAAFSLLGGVLYPIELLPTVLRWIAESLPFTWVLATIRAGLLNHSADWLRLGEIWLAAFALVPLSMWVFNAALRHARRSGTLGQY